MKSGGGIGNPNSILSHMSSRRTGIEDLKSDLISRVFAQALDTEKRNVAKGLKIFQQQLWKYLLHVCDEYIVLQNVKHTLLSPVHLWRHGVGDSDRQHQSISSHEGD